LLSDAGRATLGEIGHRLGRKVLAEVATVARPDTMLAWYRKADRTRRAKNASNFVLQWVQQAAHKRSIKALNSAGRRVQFNPLYHRLGEDAGPGDYVRVVKPSIVRGDGAQ
jgi:hypothetical protein